MSNTSDTTNDIIKFLNASGCVAHRNHTTGIRGRSIAKNSKSVGDIICCLSNGMYLEIEIKTGNDRLSKGQQERKEKISKIGLYLEVKSFDDFLDQYVSRWLELTSREK